MSPPFPAAAEVHVLSVPYTDERVLPLIAELSAEYDARYGRPLPDPRTEARRGAVEFGAPDGGVVLLVLDDEPVAGGAFRRHDARTAELKRIWTAAGFRRRGLARRVLVELEREIAARGYRRIHLTTGPRQPEARGLYLSTGYTPLFDPSLDPERVGIHPFTKDLP